MYWGTVQWKYTAVQYNVNVLQCSKCTAIFGNKVLNFGTKKVLWGKNALKFIVSGNKVKSFWDSIFYTFFSDSSMITYKKVSGKKSCYNDKCMIKKDVYNHGKRGLILNTLLAVFNMQMHRRKFLFMKTSQTRPHFSKTLEFISSDILSQDFRKLVFLPKFLFPVFFLETFFLWFFPIDWAQYSTM